MKLELLDWASDGVESPLVHGNVRDVAWDLARVYIWCIRAPPERFQRVARCPDGQGKAPQKQWSEEAFTEKRRPGSPQQNLKILEGNMSCCGVRLEVDSLVFCLQAVEHDVTKYPRLHFSCLSAVVSSMRLFLTHGVR